MLEAINLARLGEGRVNPNPLVGTVIVKNGKIIAKGYHKNYGGNHSEINAIEAAKEDLRGADLYVNLEPCSHYGKTPPCADRIVKEGIRRVYIGMEDPNKKVAGRGIAILKSAGIEVEVGILEDKSRKLNETFIKYMEKKLPFVAVKTAMTLDGKIATEDFKSKWITSQEARELGHRLRKKYVGIMVGINTVIKDDPSLTCRLEEGRNPIKIILDTRLRISLDAKVLRENPEDTIIFTSKEVDGSKEEAVKALGGRIFKINTTGEGLDLKEVLKILGKEGIDSVLIEGGAEVNFSAFKEGIVDKVYTFIAPKIMGGIGSKTPVGGSGVKEIDQCFKLEFTNFEKLSEDFYLEAYVRK